MTQAAESTHAPEYPWLARYPDDVDWYMPLPAKPVYTLLDEAADRIANNPAIDFMDKRMTYGDLRAHVDAFAAGLQRLGIGRGDRVGLFLPNTPYYVIAYYGTLKSGAAVVNFNPLYADREIRHQIQDSNVQIMVTMDLKVLYDKLDPLLGLGRFEKLVVCPMAKILPFPKNLLFPIAKRADVAKVTWDERRVRYGDVARLGDRPKSVDVDPSSDIAVIQYTGGTTGVPKGAMLTHHNIYSNALQSARWCAGAGYGEERMLGVLPFFHVFAMTVVMNISIAAGAEIIALPRFELDTVMATIDKKKPTLFPAVPTIYTAVNQHKERHKYDLSSIKFCISGGAPLPIEVKQTFEQVTGCRLVEGYGLSEASPVTHCNPINGLNKTGSIGLPVPGTHIRIISLEDRKTVMPTGERGELCVSGPQVMVGYWNKPEETADTIVDGWLHTGDVGYMDEDGFVFIVDRIKDVILCGGYNVYPRNIEEAIYLHEAVAECVVAGIPDDYRGQTVKAWIKLKDGAALTADGLETFLKDKLSPIERPKVVEFRDTPLPKTLIGKLSRKALLDEEAGTSAG